MHGITTRSGTPQPRPATGARLRAHRASRTPRSGRRGPPGNLRGVNVRCFVALGDSVTEGVGDPRADGSLRGWADLLAEWIKPQRYENLALRGLLTREIRDRQLDRALAFEPDLASIVAGMNDVLRSSFDPAAFRHELTQIVEPLRSSGAQVITSTFGENARSMLLPKAMRAKIAERLHQVNDAVRAVSAEFGAICVDEWADEESTHSSVLSVDRLHPGPVGHLLIATRVAACLNEQGGYGIEIPDGRDGWIGASSLEQARWLLKNVPVRRLVEFAATSIGVRSARP